MKMITCPNCGGRVVLSANGECPGCRQIVDSADVPNEVAGSKPVRQGSTSGEAPMRPGGFGSWLYSLFMLLAWQGVCFASLYGWGYSPVFAGLVASFLIMWMMIRLTMDVPDVLFFRQKREFLDTKFVPSLSSYFVRMVMFMIMVALGLFSVWWPEATAGHPIGFVYEIFCAVIACVAVPFHRPLKGLLASA